MSLNVEDLLYALDNDNNTGVAGLTASKIKQEKNDVLQKLQLSKEELKDFHTRLADYRYVDEINGLQDGRYIRWIPLNLICRNVRKQSIVVKFDNVLIFQKLSEQELILVKALTILDKK